MSVLEMLAQAAAEQAAPITVGGAIGAVLASVFIKILTSKTAWADNFFSSKSRPRTPETKGQFRRVLSLIENLTERQADCMKMQASTALSVASLADSVGKLVTHIEIEEEIRRQVELRLRGAT